MGPKIFPPLGFVLVLLLLLKPPAALAQDESVGERCLPGDLVVAHAGDGQAVGEWSRSLADSRLAQHLAQADFQPEQPARDVTMMNRRGEAAFWNSCIACHDANRALERSKSRGEWRATVRRMAAKEGAAIQQVDIESISEYLASLTSTFDASEPDRDHHDNLALNGTISAVWRGGSDGDVEKPGFFVDAWVGAEWQPSGPVRANIMACTSCHSDRNASAGFAVELVEASATVNLSDLLSGESAKDLDCQRLLDVEAKAGRFIVPFGGIAAMNHPGVYRTISMPLMFNMGRRVGPIGPLQPVLPGPYSDEGVNVHSRLLLTDAAALTLDVFAVNGLQQGGPGIFNASRRYYDNNREPAVGGRATVGASSWRLGASLMSGTLQDEGSPQLGYQLMAADATWRYQDRLRTYYEYAIRSEDSLFVAGGRNHTYGMVVEAEYYLPNDIPLSLLARYDTLEHRDVAQGNVSTDRFTWGLNYLLPGGSLLMLNHEHWMLETQPGDVDVIGIRWTATF